MSISNSFKRKNLPTALQTFREKEKKQGYTRQEIPMSIETKEQFLLMVKSSAENYIEPKGELGRMKKAKIDLFKDMVSYQYHNFQDQQTKLEHLEADNQRRYHSFYDQHQIDDYPIPKDISSLPDNPNHLKKLLAKYFSDNEELNSELTHLKWFSERTEKTIEVMDSENDRLRLLLKKHDIPT